MIHNIEQLADYVGAARPDEGSIARRLYKDSNCGVSFGMTWDEANGGDEETVVKR